jgi:hypothetical protein
MHRHRTPAALALLALVAALPARAPAATCTVEALALVSYVPDAGDFVFSAVSPSLVLPVDVDEAAGTLTVRREGLGVQRVNTQGGPVDVTMGGPPVTGTIDAAGNVRLPGFDVNTKFAGIIDLPTNPTLSTGRQSRTLRGVERPTRGVPLDFSTGLVTLEGADIVPSAPIVESPVISGLRLTCRLEPIPSPAALPSPATLALKGAARVGNPATGDTLSLQARVVGPPPDFRNEDVFVELGDAAGAPLAMVLVRAGGLKGKGKRLSARDRDGETVRVLAGRKVVGDEPVVGGGTLVAAVKKAGATVKVKVKGLDLAALPAEVTATVTVGATVATARVPVRGSGKKRKLG